MAGKRYSINYEDGEVVSVAVDGREYAAADDAADEDDRTELELLLGPRFDAQKGAGGGRSIWRGADAHAHLAIRNHWRAGAGVRWIQRGSGCTVRPGKSVGVVDPGADLGSAGRGLWHGHAAHLEGLWPNSKARVGAQGRVLLS